MADNSFRLSSADPTTVPCIDKRADGQQDAELRRTSVPFDSLFPPLETVYGTRRTELIRHLKRLGVDFVEAEDIIQEVFLKIFASSAQGKCADSLFHWVLTCARNLSIDHYRHRRRELLAPATLWRAWEESLEDCTANGEVRMSEKDEQRLFAQAIAMLNALEQQCLILRSRGVTFREMTTALNIPMQRAVYTTDVAIQKIQRRLKCKRE
jgi:RNA polymerase sigma factor (sigma-70 family)